MSYVSYNNIVARASDTSGILNTNPNASGGVRFSGETGQRITVNIGVTNNSNFPAFYNVLTKDFSVIIEFTAPRSNPSPSDAYGLWFISGAQNSVDVIGSIGAWINSDGSLQIFFRNAANGSTGVNASYAGFMSAFAGKIVNLAFVRGSSGNPSIYINGQNVNSLFSFSENSWTWQSQVGSTTTVDYFTIGTRGDGNEFIGDIYYASIYSGALPASVVLATYLNNGTPQGAYTSGSFYANINKLSDSGNFTSIGNFWILGNGATISGGVANLTPNPNANIASNGSYLPSGKASKLFFDILTADSEGIYISDGTLTTVLKDGITGTGTKIVELIGGSGGAVQFVAKAGTAVIDNVDHYQLGAVGHYSFVGNVANYTGLSSSFNASTFGTFSFLPAGLYFFATNLSAQNSSNLQRIKRIGQGLDYYNQTGPKSSTVSTAIVPVSGSFGNQITKFLSYTGDSISGVVIEVPDYRFEKCFLKSMSVNFEPWSVCQASLQFDCYGLMTASGIFSQATAEIKNSIISPLRGTNVSIYNYGLISGKITEYESLSFEISIDRVANYEIGSEYPAKVSVARITKTLQINGISNADWISDYQANQEFTSVVAMSDGTTISVDGFLTNQSFSVDANGVAKTNLTIVEEVV